MNLNNKETFFTLEGGCDKKNRLRRSDARLTEQEVARIDSGELSLEDLDALVARKAKIFKYQTQITIHADFPREVGDRVNDYAFLTNNKNGSVGVRYGAIDEAKRQRLARFLDYEGFRYCRNSTQHVFNLWRRFNGRSKAVGYLGELKTRYDYDALRGLIYGRIDIYGQEAHGFYYVALAITVNAIPEANIPEFLRLMRCKPEEEITAIEEAKELEREASRRKQEQERIEQQERDRAAWAIKREKMLTEMRRDHRQITDWPDSDFSLCLVTKTGRLVVVKQFRQKNGKILFRKYIQKEDPYALSRIPEYQKWNDLRPPHSCLDTCSISDEQFRQFIADGAVFAF